MLNATRQDHLVQKVGGRFKLVALIQRRWLQLLQGARPMVDPEGMTDIEIVMREIEQDKIAFASEADETEEDDEQA